MLHGHPPLIDRWFENLRTTGIDRVHLYVAMNIASQDLLDVMAPSWGWLYLSGAITLSYLKYIEASPGVAFGIRLLEFVPLYVLLGVQAVRHRHPEAGPGKTMTLMVEKSQ